ncbi:MAG: DNA gyrase inhibitor YacG [Devosia sp.]|jgi:endogenous inhibitor of DNA gyrase (YacG/DUF329 family)
MAQVVRLKPARKCPICGKPATQANYPFCSPRCQDIDLNRWLSDSYRVPTNEAPKEVSNDADED